MNLFKRYLSICFVLCLFFSSVGFAAPLEITPDGKVNIDKVVHLEPQSTPPENPSPGDLYFTTENMLMLYTTKWIPVLKSTLLGVETRTVAFTNSNTWVVPDTVQNITVTLVAGGRRGGTGAAGLEGNGGTGGGSGEIITSYPVAVTPGENIAVTIGSSNQHSQFGSYLTARYNIGNPGLSGGSSSVNGCVITPGTGGRGAHGYGNLSLASSGSGGTIGGTLYGSGGSGGVGYGAGGGGGGGNGAAGGAGAPGYCLITYEINKYEHPDGTIYYEQVN